MPGRGRRKAELSLTAAERAELVRTVRAAQSWQSYVLRCRIVLASADGATDIRIAQDLGISMPTVGKWRSRFRTSGIDGLVDAARPGRKPVISREDIARITALATEDSCEDPGVSPAADEARSAAGQTLDALAEAARGEGIEVDRGQLLRILEAEGVRWRRTASDDVPAP
ncbi:helix-turn-helix domain-containing protein [Actinospica durhamensis]|uniref:Helix-turn-helix domain-containing protein n=1 Tax=Actinospica durhamensis TaxID=1508375 RepID=A0A941EZ59_9ACTN|nr:helix-turn-helix domain-containing protein [Actinospica durhamensis]MBR7839182.1 helix-turn-helix domain-containing protein [Actinospica durhamensis]